MSRLNDMFETESQYRACFAEKYLKSDARRILLAYKIQFRLNKVAREIDEAAKGYWYVPRAKNLLWALLVQGVLNHRGFRHGSRPTGPRSAWRLISRRNFARSACRRCDT